MNAIKLAIRIAYISILIFFIVFTSFSQAVHPQNLFEAGLNIAYLDGHHAKGIKKAEAPIWAGDASAEWLSSWNPGAASPISPDLDNPSQHYSEMVDQMVKMSSCNQAYFSLRLSIYKLGYTLGHAIVETGYECTSCLQTEMQKAVIELRTIGQFLKSAEWQNLSSDLNNSALALNGSPQEALARQENEGRFGYLQSLVERVSQLLPNELIPCKSPTSNALPLEDDSNNNDEKDKRKNRKMIIMAGTTSAFLSGDAGSTSLNGSGFFAGFEMEYGRRLFINTGLDFFRNSAGKEYFFLNTGQIGDPGEYMQSFRASLGLGVYLIDKKKLSLCIFGNIRLLTGTSINGNLSSSGNVLVEQSPIHLNFGSRINFKFFTLQIAYENGLSPILTSAVEDFNYRILSLGLGVNF